MENKTVFICDDDSTIVDMLQMLLEMSGYDTIIETNSLNALGVIREKQPDVILLDIWMPMLSGDELIRKIREDKELKELFIICISASKDGKDVAFRAGANRFIAKPFDINDLLEAVESSSNLDR
ncbi:PleD family two-component system response regulator [Sphingobacterium sp. 2149]|uniref:response regulator n=1 Tax=Sphingobacterium sp. 2149 TaxID=2817763 RepID=UPI001AE6C06C|nr:response regulator [Sphingobacterium sp. 2149]MDR6737887.1 CheY-like chemotaxis protein [Sphingobacterium sp. 2149]